jgi:mannobiose 2-epimerase
MHKKAGILADALRVELTGNILPFWENMTDDIRGGFFGRMTGEGRIDPRADKGAVLNARILWTFSAAYRVLGGERYLDMAERARDYLLARFVDEEYGGIYWTLDYAGRPLEMKKQMYAIGFAIYGLSEFFRATGDRSALDAAVELFGSVEKHAFDPLRGGYFEAFDRMWQPLEDMRLSLKDENMSKTMNTHLHILEPYTNLYRVWPDALLEERLRGLLSVFTENMVGADGHLRLFFDEEWHPHGDIISYGHDIEASWLMHEAALVLDDSELLERVGPFVLRVADAASDGLQDDGSIIYEYDRTSGRIDRDRHWWPQAEAVVGYYNIYRHFGDGDALERAVRAWEYISSRLVDREKGEWFWSIRSDGSVNSVDDKAGMWKCPYHNGRMCLEVIESASVSET